MVFHSSCPHSTPCTPLLGVITFFYTSYFSPEKAQNTFILVGGRKKKPLCTVKYYSLALISVSYLKKKVKICLGTISSDPFISKLEAHADCIDESRGGIR